MENKIYSKHDGTVKFLVREGELVDAGKILVTVQ